LLLGLALVAAAATLFSLSSELTFFQDSWAFLMNRRELSADALLQPHNEHIVVLPVAIFQLLLHTFGMSSTRPEFAALTLFLLATAIALFAYVRRRTGPWPALMAATVLLFLGPAWQDLLWPFQIGLVGSVLCGVAMLLALDRDDERGDALACGLLILACGFSSLGLAFAVAAAVDVLQRRRDRGLRRAYLVAVPLALYAAWYLGWGHDAESHLSLHNVLVSPRFVWQSLIGSTDSLLALATIFDETVGRSKWAIPVLAVALAWAVRARRRGWRFPPDVWPVLAAALTFWLLAAFNFIPGREPYSSRYLYVSCIFVLLIGANLLRGARFSRPALLVGGALTLAIVGFNLVPLREGRDFLREQTVLTRSDLAAIEIARESVDPAFGLTPEVAGSSYLVNVTAGEYLAAADEYGSPAYTPAELAVAPAPGRAQADVVLANALPVAIETETGSDSAAGRRCATLPGASGAPAPSLLLAPGVTAIELPPGDPGTIGLRRFAAGGYPLESEVAAGTTTLLRIPRDAAPRRWRLRVEAAQGARVCQRASR
jgi:hypothetical protein